MIDLSRQVIRARMMEDWWKGTKFLKRLHGGITNDSGVFTETETVELARIGKCNASISIAQNDQGMWLTGEDYNYGIGGGGHAPSVWSRVAYESREDAIFSAKKAMAQRFDSISEDRSHSLTDAMKAEAKRVSAALSSILSLSAKPKQLTLF